ncbi:ESC2 Protein ESC2 [Candida maltosa Xu316]|uniref:Rad60/SUMO-like domain-containing protein n=1 Tax=Candida maltosa (strain Xu316) TaxID=1245528 RepID=M3K4U0_CANMX|nr:hypothetical protein G210_5412 [Candida maltosa Xu316]
MDSSSFISETEHSITDNETVDRSKNQDDAHHQSPKKKKRSLLDDDFFSLAGSFEGKKKKKHKHKHKKNEDNIVARQESIGNSGSFTDVDEINVKPEQGKSTSNVLESPPPAVVEKLRSVSITPPPTNREQIRNEIANRLNSQHAMEMSPKIEDSEDEESDEELKELLKLRNIKSNSATEKSPEIYNFDPENEKKRKYVVKISSKLPTPDNQVLEVDFGTKGMKSFEKILKAAVGYFKKVLATKLSPIYLLRYTPEAVSLVWVEGKTLIQPFYTPRTLRIPPPGEFNPLIEDIEKVAPTTIHVFLIPVEYNTTFTEIYPEFKASKQSNMIPDPEPEPVEVQEESSSSDDDEEEFATNPIVEQPAPVEEEKENTFVIGMKGKDNKRLEVKVSPETKLRNLVSYYLKQKGINDDGSNVKLIFDDEELDLNETIGDTEIEEDFEIQVII